MRSEGREKEEEGALLCPMAYALLIAFLCLLSGACSSSDGRNVSPIPSDTNAPGREFVVFTSDVTEVLREDVLDIRGEDEWELLDDTGDLSPEFEDGGAEEFVMEGCSKDSDCAGALLELGPCQKAVCNKHTGKCVPGPKFPGEPCDDGNACTIETTCTSDGLCVGKKVVCDDGNVCTTDTCLPDKGCVFLPNENVCDDGNLCTKNDKCSGGACVGEESDECGCTEDADCEKYNDADACNGVVKCIFGTCKVAQSTVKVCKDDNPSPCRKVICQPETGECVTLLSENGRPCDDGDACTVGDLCLNGECIGSAPLPCDDGNPCTIDTCDHDVGCVNEFSLYPCEDADPCTVNDYCRYGTCFPGTANACSKSTCYPRWPLMCGMQDAWSTAGDGATMNVNSYPCSAAALPGPEYTYALVAPWNGVANVTLVGLVPGLQVMVLESTQTGCDPVNCRASSAGVLLFDMFEGRTYYIVVDSATEEGGEYLIQVECTPHTEILCGDGLDDDKDGLTDCQDADCEFDSFCPKPLCTPVWTLQCGAQDFGENYGLGSTRVVTHYADPGENKGCLDNQWDYLGPEFAYRFDAPGDFNVTVKLSGETAQTDLLVLQDNGAGCRPEECIAWGFKKVSFPAKAGTTYYFVVDGYSGAEGKFNIEVICPSFVETLCQDGQDNDLDTFTDCEDPDCFQAIKCVGHCKPARSISCGFTEAFANFGWGSTFAVDHYSCTQYTYPGPEIAYLFKAPYDTKVKASLKLESESTDLLVLEGASCDPAACIGYGLAEVEFEAEKNKPYSIVVDGWKGAMGTFVINVECTPETEVVCNDLIDNDFDGLLDCADEEDCFLSPDCPHCESHYPLACGDIDQWSNGGEGSTDDISVYSCNSATYDGPEFAYPFEVETSGAVTLMLESENWDLDVFVLRDNGYGCNPADCIAWGANQVTFDAVKGVKYHIVVDGYGKAPPGFGSSFGTGNYTLTVTCK